MAYIPPQQRQPPGPGPHPRIKRLLIRVLVLIAIPVVAYGLFLVAVLLIATVAGPIKCEIAVLLFMRPTHAHLMQQDSLHPKHPKPRPGDRRVERGR